MELTVNGRALTVEAADDTPLLWVLRDHLGLTGTKYGCGVGQCGACTVHVNGAPRFSCLTPVASVAGSEVTTIEGLSSDGNHPLQRAWIAEQVPQCGYCQSGQIMRAAALLQQSPKPERSEITAAMSLNRCRCGTYNRIFKAVERAAKEA